MPGVRGCVSLLLGGDPAAVQFSSVSNMSLKSTWTETKQQCVRSDLAIVRDNPLQALRLGRRVMSGRRVSFFAWSHARRGSNVILACPVPGTGH